MDSKLDRIKRRYSSMKAEYDDFVLRWRDIAKWQAPFRGRFLQGNSDKKLDKRTYNHILNNRAGNALRDAVGGITAGTASPSTKWFTSETPDPNLMRIGRVQKWVYQAEKTVAALLRESNFYSEYPVAVAELLLFSTTALIQQDDFEFFTRFQTPTIGSYLIGKNSKGEIDTIAITHRFTGRELLEKFEKEKVRKISPISSDFMDQSFDIVQFIEPNPAYELNALRSDKKRFLSTWYRKDSTDDNAILRESGFDRFPAYVLRWALAEGYSWGVDSPGMVAQPDVRSLQQREKDKAKAIDRHVRPKLKGPTSLAGLKLGDKSGDVIVYDTDSSREGLSPIYQVDPRINEMRQDIQFIEAAINEAYFVDLFKAISSMKGVQPRNQLELSQRNAEALLLLGPVLERVQRELLAPVVETTFQRALEEGVIPPPPPELENGAIEVRFISSLAQAQRSQDLSALGDYTQFAGAVAQALPYVQDKVDGDAILDLFVNLRGVNPAVNRDQEQVSEIRQQRAQSVQEQQQAELDQSQATTEVQRASANKIRSETDA